MDPWECQFCTALNDPSKERCWKCSKPITESEVIRSQKERVANQQRQGVISAQLAKREVRDAATKLANEMSQAGTLAFKTVLAPYVDCEIGMNIRDPVKVVGVKLVSVQSDHFAVSHDGLVVRLPYSQILRVSEPTEGNAVAVGWGSSYLLLIEVFHMVVYKGAVGIGISIPL